MSAANGYRGQDLRGRSFAGEEMADADFSESDVRGADFTGANLARSRFVNARLGVRPITGMLILAGTLVLSVLTGVAIGLFTHAIVERTRSSDWRDLFAALTLTAVIAGFVAVFIKRGAATAVRWFAVIFVAVLAIDFVVVYMFAGELRFRQSASLIVLFLLFAPAVVAGIVGRVVGGTFGGWAMTMVALVGGFAAGRARGGLATIVVMVVLLFVSKRALKMDERDRQLWNLGHAIVTRWGTRFTAADLSGADFTDTRISQCDLSHATVDGSIWTDGGPDTMTVFEADPP